MSLQWGQYKDAQVHFMQDHGHSNFVLKNVVEIGDIDQRLKSKNTCKKTKPKGLI